MHSASHCSFYSTLYHKTSQLRNKTILCSGVKYLYILYQNRTTIYLHIPNHIFLDCWTWKKIQKTIELSVSILAKKYLVPTIAFPNTPSRFSLLFTVGSVTQSILFAMYGMFCI